MAYDTRPTHSPLGPKGGSLSHTLAACGGALRLSFYACMRHLECRFRDAPRFGEALDPAQEPLRFGQDPSLAFQSAAWTSVHDGDAQQAPRLALSYFGMVHPNGPLPTHLVQYIDDQLRHRGDGTWVGFLDIFHHRLVSLFYRAWANAEPVVGFDRPATDPFARHLGALLGQTSRRTAADLSELDTLSLGSAPHFCAQTRHAEGLAKTLEASFAVPVAIEEFVGRWLDIPPEYAWAMPKSDCDPQGAIGVLGESTRLGSQLWSRTSKFRVVLGPLWTDEHERFLPGGKDLPALIELVQRYAGLELSWDLHLILRRPERRPAVLGVVGRVGLTANLGQCQDRPEAFEDLIFDPMAATGNGITP